MEISGRAVCALVTVLVSLGNPALALDESQGTSSFVRKNFTVEDGLLSNVVHVVLQTRDGFLWVGTKEGLLRFDGRHFTPIDFLPQASPVSAVALAEAPDGALWVGTTGGLARIASGEGNESGHITSAMYHPGTGDADSIQCLHFSRSGDLYVGTIAGLYRFDRGRFVAIIPDLWTSRVEESSNGHLLVITSKGFVEWDGERIIPHPDLPARLGVRYNEIFHVYEDRAGVIWYCTVAGLARQVHGSIERLPPYGHDVVFRVSEDPQGAVWFSQSSNLYRIGPAGRELIASYMRAAYVEFDREGDVWVAAKADGLFRLKTQAVRMFTRADGLPLGVPTSVLVSSDGKLWVGSNCGGLSWWDGSRFHTYSERDGLANSCVFALAEDRNHDILVGTSSGGVFRLRDGRFAQFIKEDTLRNNIPVSILPARDGTLWVAFSGGGLSRVQNGQLRQYSTADGLSSNSLLSAYEDRRGVIWVETTKGIDRLEKDRFVAVSKTQNASIGEGRFGFGEDRFGELFAYGPVGGTFHVGENRAVRLDGAPRITGMVESRENLWLCGDGIYRAEPGSLEKWERDRDAPPDYTRFDRADGMNSPECGGGFRNMAVTGDDRLWVATEQGVAMLELSQLRHTQSKPAIFMERVVVGKTSQPPGRELALPAGTNHVELHFDTIELASPEAIRAQYRLDDVDREWLDADASVTATYSGIPVGTHGFHVRACNRDGVWDQSGIVYNVTQQPYFYETALFRLAVLAGLALLLAGAYRLRLRRITAQMNARLDERVAERTRVARDLHDTLLQTVQALKMVATEAIGDADDPTRTRQTLHKLSSWLGQATEEARASLLSLRASATEVNDLAEALHRAGEECAAAGALQFTLTVKGAVREMHPIVRDEVYRIGYEAIRNASIHSGGAKVEVVLTYARSLGLLVRDDGKGIDPDTVVHGKPGHFGLTGMQERATRIGARMTVRSAVNAGTEVDLTVPGHIGFRQRRSFWKRRFKPV